MKSVELKDVHVRFGKVHALRGVNVALRAGEVTMLVGPNGAGKTTLARVLLGLVRSQSGTLSVDGTVTSVGTALKKQLGYLPEAVAFSENLSARQVLRFFSWARGVPKRRIDESLERVGLLHAARRQVRGFSRGMRQRLGLAVAILAEPPLLILDEPAGGLDSEGLGVVWSILEEWRQAGRLVMLSSHQLALMERRVDRICVFEQGAIIATGSAEQLRELAGLRHRVSFELAADAEAFIAELRGWGPAEVELSDGAAVASVRSESLLGLMDIRGRHADAVNGLRIEEPTLDMAYETLLSRAS